MSCPECKKDFGSPHGLKVHRSRAHAVGHTAWCGICGKGFASPRSLDNHGYSKHFDDHDRQGWMTQKPRPEVMLHAGGSNLPDPLAGAASAPIHATEPPEIATESENPATRLQRERNGALKYADLPWVKFPRDEHECDEALNLLAVAIEKADRSLPFLCSLRANITELRRRLAQPAAA